MVNSRRRRRKKNNRRATIIDVAERASVSTATVSRVLNDTGLVSEITELKVRQAIQELHYTPHGAARNLAGNKTNMVGLVLPGALTPFFASLIQGIDQYKYKGDHAYSLLIHVRYVNTPRSFVEPLVLGEHNTDGLIIFTDSIDDDTIRRLYRHDFPMVLLHRSAPEETQIPCVKYENQSGVREMMEHLIVNCGYRRIAHLRGPVDNEDAQERAEAYRQTLTAHGISIDPDLIGPGNFLDYVAEETVTAWLEQNIEIEAIFAGDDNSAIGTMTALRRAGKHVPEDVAVVGFNDDTISRHLSPPLTTVRAHSEEAGEMAARQLLRLIQGKSADMVTLLPTELVVRESCGWRQKRR